MITDYRRPLTLEDALTLASRHDVVLIGGGTSVAASRDPSPVIAVDLQALPLATIEATDGALHVGATTRLRDFMDSPRVPAALGDLARREVPSVLRNAATIGGTIGTADPESQLLTGLLAFGATVIVARVESRTEHPLDDILEDPGLLTGAIITGVRIPLGGRAAAERTGRTPMDQPIVLAVAHHSEDGVLRLGMSGVSDHPVIVDPDRIGDLDPPSDFRGSSSYRSQIASVLAGRAVRSVGGDT
ncbi:MAG TPA: FAD binding domain-containing protein [Acidimicrobiia bacterium]|nr:FAD binding domain-containing protein [Acidimicrobiia bacterium]